MYLTGVSKTYSNVSSRVNTRYKPKTNQMAFYITESGSFKSKNISKMQYYYLKYFKRKWKKRKFICTECGNIFQGLIKSSKDEIECPNCL